jgi:multidrug efflux pump
MDITSYFIKHPVKTIILNCFILLIGFLCFSHLGVREYPNIVFPTLTVTADYPNASADLVESSVTNIIEDQLAGIEGIESIISSSYDNSTSITLKFRLDTSMDRALIVTKDAIGLARSHLPDQVKEPIVSKAGSNDGPPFMAICLESPNMNLTELTHYTNLTLKNSFRSIKGVSSIGVWGRPYTYKITLDHQKMYNFAINADEIFDAIKESKTSLPAGKFRNEHSATINSSLEATKDFENILIKSSPNPVFLKNIADIELTENNQDLRMKINGNPGLCIGLYKTSDDNPLETSTLVHKQVSLIKQSLPSSVKMGVTLDQAEFIRSSLQNIQSSIIEAIFFVLLIVFLFLRNIRATLIPIVTIPISLIGSLLFLKLFGFSINNMTLLAMVLAVGLVVDDAIVVLENITRHLENGKSPLNAAIDGSKEIGFAIVAMTLTLTSVYAPIAFIQGLTGQLFIEFAAALSGSVLISGIVALTLSPLMCASILKTKNSSLLPQIDIALDKLCKSYASKLKHIINYPKFILTLGIIILSGMIFLFQSLPSETIPNEDRSLLGIYVPPIPGKKLDNMEENVNKVESIAKNLPEAQGVLTVVRDQGGQVIFPLKSINQRKRSATTIVNDLQARMMSLPSLDAWVWNWSNGLPGVDQASENSEISLIISTTAPYKELLSKVNKIRDIGEKEKLFPRIYHNLKLNDLGYNIDIDKDVIAKLNLKKTQIAKMVEIFFSGNSSLDFKKDGILYPIKIEGDINPWNLDGLYVVNPKGKRISIGSLATLTPKATPKELNHYNQMRSATLKTELKKGDNIADFMAKLYKLADDNLPGSYKKDWTGIAKTYKDSSSTMITLFLLALLFIYAVLAVQFESFIDPLIILLTVPLACFGALLVLYISQGTLNIYSQIGLITLVGLITKHGILIVEFANQLQKQGHSLLDSIIESTTLRLRPILMTTGAMIFGSIPLILSNTAGSEARYAIGIVLISGLSIGTIFTLFVLPNIYIAFNKLKG